jgi:methylthioribose-1-phosphate isomerase
LINIGRAAAQLKGTRPTAADLAWAIERQLSIAKGKSSRTGTIRRKIALALAQPKTLPRKMKALPDQTGLSLIDRCPHKKRVNPVNVWRVMRMAGL